MTNAPHFEITHEYLQSQGLSITFPKRFWSKVDKSGGPDACWLWTGSTRPCSKLHPIGHGMIQRSEGVNCKIYSHRAAWILCRVPIPDGKKVLHRCPGGDEPRCCNPDHLMLGDDSLNMRHMTDDGHNYFSTHSFKGESHALSKMTWEQVREMRNLRNGGVPLKDLSKIFHISISQCSLIVRGFRWVE